MTQDTQMTVTDLTEGTLLTELCVALTTLKKQACHAAAILSDAQKIQDTFVRKSSIEALAEHFNFLRPDFTLAIAPQLADTVILMREAVQAYISGLHLGAVHIERVAATSEHNDVTQWMIFSFISGQRNLAFKVPLSAAQHRSGHIAMLSSVKPLASRDSESLSDTDPLFELQSLFCAAALKHAQNEWSFVSMPTQEACDEATRVLGECLPVFTAARQLPAKYHPRLR